MAQAAPDPGTGPISPSKKRVKRGASTITAIPAGTGLMPGAVWVDPLPTSLSPTSSASPSSSPSGQSSSSSAASNAVSSTLSQNTYGIIPPSPTGIASSSILTMPNPSGSPSASLAPISHPMPSASSGVDISISINDNQIIYVDSPEYGAAGYGWWSCPEESPTENSVEMIGGNGAVVLAPEYEAGTCVVGVTFLEYVYVVGGMTSRDTHCFTTCLPRLAR